MITLTLTESEAARICYALEAEANEANRRAWDEKKNGALLVASGRLQMIHEAARDEALRVVRRIEELVA
jgi:hypothetical protein